jgi:adenine-specific DNA-methyltransferase
LRYIGNKNKILNFIEEVICERNPDLEKKSFCDLFSGTGTVAKHFRGKVGKVISNDLEFYSYVLQKNYVQNEYSDSMKDLIEDYDSTIPVHGLITELCSPKGKNKRMFFTSTNAMKIDGIRSRIEKEFSAGILTESQYYFLICSLLESADKYSNTTGVYGAYLKKFNSRSRLDITLKGAWPKEDSNDNEVFLGDANELITMISGDILYLDPPYNSRQYGSNYHILNYIAKNEDIEVSINSRTNKESKTALSDYNKSAYSKKNKAKVAMENLISASDFGSIFMSYNDEGIVNPEEIEEIFSKYGTYSCRTKEHKRYKSNTNNNDKQNKSVREFIHILEKK